MQITEEQKQALDLGDGVEITVQGKECVLLSKAVYERQLEDLDDEMDYSPPTIEEMNLLADEVADMLERDELDEPLES